MERSLHRWEFMDSYIIAKMQGAADPIAAAHAMLGVTSSPEGDLLARGQELVAVLERWRVATKYGRVKLRRELKALVPKLYTDVCPECQDIVHRAIRNLCRDCKNKQWGSFNLGCFYEAVQKWLMKTGCRVCPIQKRF